MSIALKGMRELERNLAKLAEATNAEVAGALLAGGKLVETEAKKLIAVQSFGDEVTRYRAGGASYSHVASAAGDAPNTDTGNLVGSIQTEASGWSVFVGTAVEYAPHLEFGTESMQARPFLYPAVNARRDDIVKLVGKGVLIAASASSESTF